METQSIYAESLENDEPINIGGFTLYPIKMHSYRQFEASKFALLVRQGSLPVKYAFLPYLSALFAMDHDAYIENQQAFGFIGALITMLSLAMRYPVDALRKSVQFEVDQADESKLVSMIVRAGEMTLRLTPAVFDRMREIIAAQNGLELPDEAENADLVEADMDIAAKGSVNVEVNYRTLIASVARDQRCRVADLMDYTIREFNDLRDAIERDKNYMLYRMAELSGNVKFTKGNPVPSWCYDRGGKSNSLISMADFMAGPGSAASMR